MRKEGRKSYRRQKIRNKWTVFLNSLDHEKSVCFSLHRTRKGSAEASWHVDSIQTGPRCAGCGVCCRGPLAAAILSSQCDTKPKHSYDLRDGGEGERSRLTFLRFPVNQNYSSYLMMQKQSNMTFEVTILYGGTTTPRPAPSISALISTLTWLPNQDKWFGALNIISM